MGADISAGPAEHKVIAGSDVLVTFERLPLLRAPRR
jgi:hypothetical protein